jgi:hypothetical protein
MIPVLGTLVLLSSSMNADTQRSATMLYRFDDDKQRSRWSTSRPGLFPEVLELGRTERCSAIGRMALVASTPQRGFEKVEQIRDADDRGTSAGGLIEITVAR